MKEVRPWEPVARMVSEMPGFERAMESKWINTGSVPGRPDRYVAMCNCRSIASLVAPLPATPPQNIRALPVVEVERKEYRFTENAPVMSIWVGRCQDCKTVYWSGPMRAEEVQTT